MQKIPCTKFKEQCLSVLDRLGSEGVIVTKYGRPIARVIPIKNKNSGGLIGTFKDKIKIKGDVFSTGLKWNIKS